VGDAHLGLDHHAEALPAYERALALLIAAAGVARGGGWAIARHPGSIVGTRGAMVLGDHQSPWSPETVNGVG